jgi:hypothetical protein
MYMQVHDAIIFIKLQRENTPSGLLIPIPNATYNPTTESERELVRERDLKERERERERERSHGEIRGTYCSNDDL